MLERLIGDWREATAAEIRLIAVAVAAAGAATASLGLACAAVFVAVTNRFGVVNAWLTVAAVFLAVTLALLALFVALRRRAQRAASMAKARNARSSPIRWSLRPASNSSRRSASSALTLMAIVGGAMALASKPAAGRARSS